MKRIHSNRRSIARTGGYTLLELVVASASAAVLVGGLAASLYISSKSLEVTTGSLAETRVASKALDALTRDLQSALSLSELTSTSVTMTVPDRSGDSVPETIRYHWASAGAPLIRTYNGTSSDIATDVQSFSLKWLSRLIEGVSSAPVILFVSSQPPDGTGGLATPSTVEQDRIALMEGWGYNVTVISQQASQAEMDDAITDATVVYVPGVCNPTTVGSKVTSTTIGVVTESFAHAVELGFYSSVSAFSSGSTTIQITDSSHFITSGLPLGQLTVATTSQAMKWTSSPASDDASKLADVHTSVPHPTLMALDINDMRAGGGVIPGRRVQLPWGESSFDATALAADGQTIMQRSLQWAAGSNEGSTRPLLLLVGDEASPTAAETGRQSLIESWGYDVTLATANQPQSVYDTYPGSYDVVYVPSSVIYTDVNSKLKLLSIGVVNEVPDLSYYLGFTSNTDTFFATYTNITDNTHEITKPFSTGNLKVSDIPLFGSLRSFTGSIGPGLQTLSTKTSSTDRMIMTLDAGDGLLFGGTAPDRRVMLPWGTHSSHDVYNDLTADGRTIMHRAINWAAGERNATDLIAHWMLDETSGTVASDSSGNGNHGTVNGTVDWTAATLNNGHSFDYTDGEDYIEIPNSASLENVQEGDYTVSAWFRPESIPPGSGSDNDGNYGILIKQGWSVGLVFKYDGTFFFSHWLEGETGVFPSSGGTTYPAGSFYHVAGVVERAAGTAKLYVDGSLIATENFTPGAAALELGTNPWRLGIATPGASTWGWAADGVVDDARIYNRPLSDTEIADLYSEGANPSGVVYHEFTEASRSSNGSDLTVDLPPGTANGDLLVTAVVTDGNTSTSLSPPSGWNQILVDSDSQDRVTLGVWWKEAGSSEPANYTFTWSGSEKAYGMIMRFTGHKPTAPIHAQADAESGSDSNSPPSPGVTTTVDNCLILRIGGFDDDDVTNGDAGVAGHTTITAGESNNGTSSCSGAAAYVIQGTAGATGSENFSLGGAEEYRTLTIAIEPDPSP